MKIERQAKIIELITKNDIEKQEELVKKLIESGFDVTQATISRDIRELKIVKTVNEKGKNRYTIMTGKAERLNDKLIQVLKAGFIEGTLAQQMIVIKTVTGMAMGVATAIDNIGIGELLGSIAGDDTVFLVTRSKDDAIICLSKIKKVIGR